MHEPIVRTVRFASACGNVVAEVTRLGLGNRGAAFTLSGGNYSFTDRGEYLDFRSTQWQARRLLGDGARRLTP